MTTNTDISKDLQSLKIDRQAVNRKRKSRLPWLIVGVVCVAVAVLVWLTADTIKYRLFKTEIAITEVLVVSPAQSDVKLMATGYVVPQKRAIVAAKSTGRIQTIRVKEGQEVKANEEIATLESSDKLAALNEAQSAVATALARISASYASVLDTKLQLEREKKLLASGSTGQAAVDTAQSRYDVAMANWQATQTEAESARARLKNAQVNVENTKILAPFAGKIVKKLVEVGEMPTSAVGNAATSNGIVELVDFNSLVVEADVSEDKLSLIKMDQPTEITLDAHPQKRFRGQVYEIRPTVDRQKATVLVKVKFIDRADIILPQMAAKVRFLAQALDEEKLKAPAKIVVPKTAIFSSANGQSLFIVRDGKVYMTPVTGTVVGNYFELQQGPLPGTKIVLEPPSHLIDGMAIKEKVNN